MKERRSLVEGLKTNPETQQLEESFVFGDKRRPEPIRDETPPVPHTNDTPVAANAEPIVEALPQTIDRSVLPQMTGRVPITTRCRPEVASALKRASLQRQLAGIEPYYVQDIMEQALENWLKQQGFAG